MRLALLVLLTLWSAAPLQPQEAELRRFESAGTEMAAPVKIILYSADEAVAHRAIEAAFSRLRDLNSILSDYDPESELSRLSRSASGGDAVPVSADLWDVLTRAKEISRISNGAFDVTVGPVVRLWRRARRLHRLPDSRHLEEALALVDDRSLRLDPERRSVKLIKAGMRLDLGAIAKGYAADEALAVMRRHGIPSALVDVGGDIAMGDPPPGAPGWRVGIAPHDASLQGSLHEGAAAGGAVDSSRHLWLSRVAVATSGDTAQFVEIDGGRYSHIVDPRTGLGLTDHSTVTVIAPDGMTADALASAVSVLGPEEGLKLIDRTPGACGRIVQRFESRQQVYESKRWGSLRVAAQELTGGPPDELASGRAEGEFSGEKSSDKPIDPTVTPPVAWLLEPLPLEDAKAATAAEMKAYREKIPGTDVEFEMVPVPGGTFLMGSPPDEAHRAAHEGPQFEVALEPFWIGKYEVTWEEYELWGLGYDAQRLERARGELSPHDRLADAITRPTKPYSDMTFGMGREGFPAICMTQLAAKVYAKWLSAKTGRYYRLPTEAEWEYAARAGTTTAYSFGDDPKSLGDYAWYFMNSDDTYHKVGQKKPNPRGLFDMHGNVAEWVLDQFTPTGYKRPDANPCRNPLVVPRTIYPRVVRGGSWTDDADALRSAARVGSDGSWKMGDPQMPQSIWYHTDATFVGFRLVRPLRLPTAQEAERYDLDPAQRRALTDYLEFLGERR